MKSPRPVTPMPPRTGHTHPFWDALRQGRLLIARCVRCGSLYSHQEAPCPACRSGEWEWAQASGRGRLYSYAIAHHLRQGGGQGSPSVIAIVELEEGPRVMAELTGVAPEGLGGHSIGMQVQAVFTPSEGGAPGLAFRPAAEVQGQA